MVEFVGQFDCELAAEPGQTLIGQSSKRPRVKFVALDDSQLRADSTLEEDNASQAYSQDQLNQHKIPKGAKVVILMFLILMPNEEVNEDMQQLRSNDDQIYNMKEQYR